MGDAGGARGALQGAAAGVQASCDRVAGDEESGRDAVQEAFAKAIRKRRRFRGDGQLEAWLLRIVVNAARDARRRRVTGRVAGTYRDPSRRSRTPIRAPHGAPAEVLFLHYYADLDYTTIAQALDISPGTVGATLCARARHCAVR